MRADETLVSAGEVGEEMFFVAEGEVEVEELTSPAGSCVLRAGAFFGEEALISATPYMATVRAKTCGHVCALRKSDVEDVMRRFPAAKGAIHAQLRQDARQSRVEVAPAVLEVEPWEAENEVEASQPTQLRVDAEAVRALERAEEAELSAMTAREVSVSAMRPRSREEVLGFHKSEEVEVAEDTHANATEAARVERVAPVEMVAKAEELLGVAEVVAKRADTLAAPQRAEAPEAPQATLTKAALHGWTTRRRVRRRWKKTGLSETGNANRMQLSPPTKKDRKDALWVRMKAIRDQLELEALENGQMLRASSRGALEEELREVRRAIDQLEVREGDDFVEVRGGEKVVQRPDVKLGESLMCSVWCNT
eukprot:SAG11_NODE_1590_length_4624_cov_3.572376_1_plen_366_part_00